MIPEQYLQPSNVKMNEPEVYFSTFSIAPLEEVKELVSNDTVPPNPESIYMESNLDLPQQALIQEQYGTIQAENGNLMSHGNTQDHDQQQSEEQIHQDPYPLNTLPFDSALLPEICFDSPTTNIYESTRNSQICIHYQLEHVCANILVHGFANKVQIDLIYELLVQFCESHSRFRHLDIEEDMKQLYSSIINILTRTNNSSEFSNLASLAPHILLPFSNPYYLQLSNNNFPSNFMNIEGNVIDPAVHSEIPAVENVQNVYRGISQYGNGINQIGNNNPYFPPYHTATQSALENSHVYGNNGEIEAQLQLMVEYIVENNQHSPITSNAQFPILETTPNTVGSGQGAIEYNSFESELIDEQDEESYNSSYQENQMNIDQKSEDINSTPTLTCSETIDNDEGMDTVTNTDEVTQSYSLLASHNLFVEDFLAYIESTNIAELMEDLAHTYPTVEEF